MAGVVLAFLFCSVPSHAQNTYVTLKTVFTLGGTVNAVPKFTTSNHIGNSAIMETGGNVSITGNITASGTVSGSVGSFGSGGITAGGNITANGTVNAGSGGLNNIALVGLNNSNYYTLYLQNSTSGFGFLEAQFGNGSSTFYTDNLGNTTATARQQ